MESTIIGQFHTRREADLAVERVVQEYGVPRSDVFIQPVGGANSAGTLPSGADVKRAPAPEPHQHLEGALEVSVDFHGEDPKKIEDALMSTGAKSVRIK